MSNAGLKKNFELLFSECPAEKQMRRRYEKNYTEHKTDDAFFYNFVVLRFFNNRLHEACLEISNRRTAFGIGN